MSDRSRNAREQAEIAFGMTQTKELYRDRLAAEQHEAAEARRAKTERLKLARLAAEAQTSANAPIKARRKTR